MKIVVIGAGYTGLTAALRLAQKGHEVTILEKGNTVGGLASGFKVEGAPLERAYHHLFKTDTDILDMAKDLDIDDKLKWHDSSVSLYYDGVLYPFKGALDLLRFRPLYFHNRIRAGLTVLFLQKASNWKQFEHITAYSWMRKYAGEQVTKVIWEPLLKGKFDTYYNKVSMAWLWARIHIRAQSRETGGEKLGYFDGGFDVFTNALKKKLKKFGVTIRTEQDIAGINTVRGDKVKISFNNGRSETYDACISTTPSHVFANLIEANKDVSRSYIAKLRSVPYLGARILIFSSNQEISPYYWHNMNDLNLPFLVFINHTKLVDKTNYNNKHIYYVASYMPHNHELFICENRALEKVWFPALQTVFPDFDSKQIREKHHFRFSNAQHIVGVNYAEQIPEKITPLPNVYLSNFSQIFPEDRGTNYAVRDGKSVANLIL